MNGQINHANNPRHWTSPLPTGRAAISRLAVTVTILSAAMVLLLAGCASTPGGGGSNGLPQWYFDPDSVYPNEQYLTAVGTGDTTAAAEQQALSALSQIFEARVQVDTAVSERYRELATSEGTISEQDVQMSSSLNVQSDQTLQNVQFGERAVDDMGRVHIIAYLERIPTGQLYVDLIRKNAAQVDRFLSESESGELVRRYAFLSAASVVATNTEALRDQLRIIAPSLEAGLQLPYNYDELLQRRTDLAGQITVSVQVANDQNGRIASAIRAAVSEQRFPIQDQGVLTVQGSVSMEPIELNPDYETVRWNLTLSVDRDATTLVSIDESDRSSGVTQEAARSFAYQDMEEVIRKQLVGGLTDYFDGLVLGR